MRNIKKVDDVMIIRSIKELNNLAKSYKTKVNNLILNNLEKKLPPIMDNLIDITTKLDNILYKKSQETTKAIDVFNSTMRDVGEASKSFKNLADYLERHPETLLRGKEK